MIKLVVGVVAVFTVLARAQMETTMQPYDQDGVTRAADDDCSRMAFTCFKPMMSEAGNVTLGGPETWTAAQLTTRCQMLSTVKQCIDQSSVSCSETAEMQSQVFFEMMNFICKDVFSDLIELSECIGSPQSQRDVQQCVQDIAQAQAALLHSDSGEDEVESQCRVLEEYEECIVNAESIDCGERAQQLYIRIFEKMNELVAQDINCTSVDTDPEPEVLLTDEEKLCIATATQCLSRLDTYRASMTDLDLKALPKVCRIFNGAQQCMDSRASQCEVAPEWQKLQLSFAAMCNEEVTAVLHRTAPCLNKTSLINKLENCESQDLQSDADMDDETTCQILDEYTSCYATAIEGECPEEVAEAVESVLRGVEGIIELEKGVDCQEDAIESIQVDETEDEETAEMEERCAMAIAECLQPLEPHRKGFTSFQLETIPQVCTDFRKVQTCIDEKAMQCETTQEWNIIENAFSQICMPDVAEGVSDCPVSSDVVTQLKSCEKDELKDDVTLDDDRTCQVLEEYVNCYSITVERECEERDGQVVSQVMTGVAQVIQLDKEVMCEGGDESEEESEEPDAETRPPYDDNDSEEKEMMAEAEDDQLMEDTWGPVAPCMGFLADVQVSPLPIHRFESLTEFCQDAENSKTCARRLLMTAPEEVHNNWEQLMAAVDYICTEKREEFNKVYSCMVQNTDPQRCYTEIDSADGDGETVCKMVNDFEECTADLVEEDCGSDAGDLMRGLNSKMNDLLAKDYHISCPIRSERLTKHQKMVIGVSVGVASLFVVVMVAMAIATCKRRNQRSHAMDKTDLVKNDILQQNIQIGLQGSEKGKDTGVATLSVTKIDI